jgi:hypothetical protein
VPITTIVASSKPAHGEVYSIEFMIIKYQVERQFKYFLFAYEITNGIKHKS